MNVPSNFIPDARNMYFLPLGGVGRIGMNMALYGYDGQWLMVDCGVSFADASMPGIDVLMADPRFIADQNNRLAGLVITHGHEDHLGAVEHLWSRLRCPVYCTPFTSELLRAKLSESPHKKKLKILEVDCGGRAGAGPFDLQFINMAHSIPEAQALVIRTPVGQVLHTGDWKIDPQPRVGALTDGTALQRVGAEGVMALIGDSTNAVVSGHSGSEQSAYECFRELFPKIRQRIVVTCFASNLARVYSAIQAARQSGRHAALVGRSLWRIWEVAQMTGYLREVEPPLSEHEAAHAPRENIVLICTGSQGEPRSALARISDDDHQHIRLDAGDVCIFSSREIPGNEVAIAGVQNRLLRQGVQVITADDAPVHVSGHPCRDELVQLYQWTRPKLSVPVHGEERHMQAHANIARACQVPNICIPQLGQVLRLGPEAPGPVAEVSYGQLALDGKALRRLNADHGALKERQKLAFAGAVFISLAFTRRGELLDTPQITLMGIEDDDGSSAAHDALAQALSDFLDTSRDLDVRDNDQVRSRTIQFTRRFLMGQTGKKPQVDVHIVRI